MRGVSLAAAAWTACVLAVSAQNAARQTRALPANLPETNPFSSPADVAMGRALYTGRCGHCHGQDGDGGRGVPLNTGRFRYGGSDRELFATIRTGVPDTEMPGAFSLQDSEIWRLVAYVQQLGRQGAPETSAGDPAAGAAVYARHACAQCHTIGAGGGFLGPDLTDIGNRRALRHLRQSIVDPSADIPLDYRPVVVTDAGGAAISGIHLNEDEYSIHLRELNGNLRSFMKRELKDISLPRQSLMPAYPLPSAELENLVTYLASLRPARVAQPGRQPDAEIWMFDRLTDIGGHPTTVLGDPKVIDSVAGKAVEFDGIDDALLVDHHPLAGAAAFTWEAVFRPDGGAREQRWFHLNEHPATGADTENRMLFEIRVVDGTWYLDSYNQSGAASKALMNREARHPLGAWYHVASVYDGREFRNYVDGVREGSAEIQFAPQGPGRASIGVRINKVSYFKGAVRLARFTRRALSPDEFLSVQRRVAIDGHTRTPLLGAVRPADHDGVDRR
jgi:putative heme-binding domain-containing protein